MTRTDLSALAFALQAETYEELGLATPGSELSQEQGFHLCIGPVDHPICNFASRLDLNPWVANRLAEVAITRQAFNVYSAPGDRPDRRDVRHELLERAGFERSFSLNQMISDSRPTIEPADLTRAVNSGSRREICRLMAAVFFQKQAGEFRRRVVESTISASRLELVGVYSKGDLLGCLMISQSVDLVGLFNLCVRPNLQGRGFGSGMVAAVQQAAWESRRPVTLQCDDRLVPWYQRQGFQKTGLVDVYVLSRARRIDIMKMFENSSG
jgi:GNAT superfamily N-acetyltransferase